MAFRKNIKREEDTTANYVSDTWLRKSCKMDRKNMNPMVVLDLSVKRKIDSFNVMHVKCKMEMIDDNFFENDSWLKSSFQMDASEVKPSLPELLKNVKKEHSEDDQHTTGLASMKKLNQSGGVGHYQGLQGNHNNISLKMSNNEKDMIKETVLTKKTKKVNGKEKTKSCPFPLLM